MCSQFWGIMGRDLLKVTWPGSRACSIKAQTLCSKWSGRTNPLEAGGSKDMWPVGRVWVLHPRGERRSGWGWTGHNSCLSCSYYRTSPCVKPPCSSPLPPAVDTTIPALMSMVPLNPASQASKGPTGKCLLLTSTPALES